MKLAIVDDNRRDAEELRDILARTKDNHIIDLFETGGDFLAAAPERDYDLAFMDIYLPGEDGVEVVRKLRSISPQTGAVFVTVSDSHAVAAFSLQALHYLVKPFTEADVAEALRRAKEANRPEAPESTLTVTIGGDVYTLAQRDILRVEASDHKTNIFMKNGSVFSVYLAFGRVEAELDRHFLTVNRGVAVNMRHIVKWGAQDCEMDDGRRYLLNRRKRQQLKEAYFHYKLDEMADRQRER
jgi:DNA-binding LytR/AlgR family response regulator